MSFLDHIARCNNADLRQFEPWFIGTERAGFIHRDFAPVLAAKPELFTHRRQGWYFSGALDAPTKRTSGLRLGFVTLGFLISLGAVFFAVGRRK